jgi:hypothetical protein
MATYQVRLCTGSVTTLFAPLYYPNPHIYIYNNNNNDLKNGSFFNVAGYLKEGDADGL